MILIPHVPVLLKEALDALDIRAGDTVLDATFGRGGHTRAFLEKVGPHGKVIALDVDPEAVTTAQALSSDTRFTFVRQNFRNIDVALAIAGIQKVDKVFFDLGVSSPQFDQGERGFSYRFDAPLDMRMDPNQKLTAADLVNKSSEQELQQILWEYGEERWAKRIAQFIVAERCTKPILSTAQLVDIIRAAIPKDVREKEDQHPARRTFQALRIAVNDELRALKEGLVKAVDAVNAKGRVGCISFHSLEDRIVKQAFAELARECLCPANIPICVCKHRASVKLITKKPIIPTNDEVASNPRSRSARLRVVQKLPVF